MAFVDVVLEMISSIQNAYVLRGNVVKRGLDRSGLDKGYGSDGAVETSGGLGNRIDHMTDSFWPSDHDHDGPCALAARISGRKNRMLDLIVNSKVNVEEKVSPPQRVGTSHCLLLKRT